MLPALLTLDGVASMNEDDTHGYRYELAGAAYTLRVRMPLDLVRNTEAADHLS